MVVKFSRVSVWGADDLMILATFGFLIAFVPLNANAGKNGAGQDMWSLTVDQITEYFKVLGLNMKWSKKFGLMFMFSLGLFLTAASTIRLKLLVDYHQGTHNFTVGSLQIAIWSDIELCVGVFTACIPTTRQFFRVFIFGRPDGSASLHSEHIHGRSLEGSPKRSTRQAAEAVDEPSPHTP
ncbi:hypothetical protein K4K53_011715 [Colletotrichum sp. SAR 10_77]|nr:hypothetical protein K4K52_003823 [Colletotrichum sp. SAR 10_76]KAI8262502.1 hypothetical protein K4K53_011715 [Colletotrichum sp. SAR 10_77]